MGKGLLPMTGKQERWIAVTADVHPRTIRRWREGRSRKAESERIREAIIALGWPELLPEMQDTE
jgi:hypothetical protein